jgi:hypothetical protein
MENGLRDVITKMPAFALLDNISTGDYHVLGTGNLECIILQPGAVIQRNVVAAPRRIQTMWIVNIEHYLAFTGEISIIAQEIRTARQNLFDHVDKYPTLNSTPGCINAFIQEALEPEIFVHGDPRRWWRMIYRIQIEERATVTIAE